MVASSRSAAILLVDDDANDVLFLRRALKKAGVHYPVCVARDGQDGIDYLSGAGAYHDRSLYPLPCLVVLDLKMPRKNGLQVLHWIRNQPGLTDLPVVMVTSSDENGDREAAADHGVEAYRVKPVSFDELVALAFEIRIEAEDHCKDAKPCADEASPNN